MSVCVRLCVCLSVCVGGGGVCGRERLSARVLLCISEIHPVSMFV